MRVAVLGSGPSLSEFDKSKNYDMVIGANDVYFKADGVTHIGITDSLQRIQAHRPKALQTPANIPMFVFDRTWGKWATDRRNVHIIKAKCSNAHLSPKEHYLYGMHTPYFCACIAIKHGATSIDFFGVDGANWTAHQLSVVIKEINYLSKYCKVTLAESSELWEKQKGLENKLTIKSKTMKDNEVLIPSGIGDAVWVLQTLESKEPRKFSICKSNQYRAWQLLDLVPHLVESYSESNVPFSYDNNAITQANKHLENGNRIETFTGSFEFDLQLQTEQYKAKASKLLKKPKGKKLIGIYTSSLSHSWVKKGFAWDAQKWLDMLNLIKANNEGVFLLCLVLTMTRTWQNG
jgi:hypothetical protein